MPFHTEKGSVALEFAVMGFERQGAVRHPRPAAPSAPYTLHPLPKSGPGASVMPAVSYVGLAGQQCARGLLQAVQAGPGYGERRGRQFRELQCHFSDDARHTKTATGHSEQFR